MISSAIGTAGSLVEHGVNGLILEGLALEDWTAALAKFGPEALGRLREGAARTAPKVSTAAGAAVIEAALERVRQR